MPKRKQKTRLVGRDAGSGEFIPVKEARKRKKTAIVQRIKIGKRKKKK